MGVAAFTDKQPPPLIKIYVCDSDRNLNGRRNVLKFDHAMFSLACQVT